MARTLVLVRHGKAQTRSDERPDDRRTLTKAGRRALAARLPRQLSLLEPPKDTTCQLWTSPAARAGQTADMIAEELTLPAATVHQSLLDQDIPAFLDEVEKSPAQSLIVVGHNPFIEDVVKRLGGRRLRFSPGAAAALALPEDGSTDRAYLQWFVQGASARRWKTLIMLEKALKKSLKKVERRRADFLDRPEDPETLHDLRVSIRTLRSLLTFIVPFQKRRQNQSVQNSLHNVFVQTSHLRELDVLLEQTGDPSSEAADPVATCTTLRREEQHRLVGFLRGKKAKRNFGRVHRELHALDWKKSVACEGLESEQVRDRFVDLFTSFDTALAHVDLEDAEATHNLRKEAKRVRYVAEHLGRFFEGEAAPAASLATEVQDWLGDLRDARINVVIAEEPPQQRTLPSTAGSSNTDRAHPTRKMSAVRPKESGLSRYFSDTQS